MRERVGHVFLDILQLHDASVVLIEAWLAGARLLTVAAAGSYADASDSAFLSILRAVRMPSV